MITFPASSQLWHSCAASQRCNKGHQPIDQSPLQSWHVYCRTDNWLKLYQIVYLSVKLASASISGSYRIHNSIGLLYIVDLSAVSFKPHKYRGFAA